MTAVHHLLPLAMAALFAITGAAAHAAPGQTLAQAKARGAVRCGVSEGIAGFSIKDAAGRWTGLDADFCRAVAAAALGSADQVIFVPLRASARFPALRAGQIDLLARNTTWTLLREAALQLQFAGILYYDGQGFMVPAKSRIKTLAELKGATVCVEKATTAAENFAVHAASVDLGLRPLVFASADAVADAFFAGKCLAYSSDASQLAAARTRAPGGLQSMVILPERISREPLGPAVRAGDDAWLTLVRWVLFALVAAEEGGATRENVRERVKDPALQRMLAKDEEISRALGVGPGWAVRAVESAGNYGEMFERNLGRGSPLKLERGLNRLWNQGGLMYSPPMR